ncbi:MAG: adenosylcobinamide-phosphate synthase CbiB, partial [Stellaceae bacterium]
MLVPAGAADPCLILLLVLALDLVLGGFPALWRIAPHPVTWIGAAIAWLDRRLNRERRSERVRRVRGVFSTALLVLVAGLLGIAFARALGSMSGGVLIEAPIVAVLLAERELFDRVAAVAAALPQGIAEGREAVRHIVGRDPESLDAHGVARAAIESLAENFSDGVVAPALYFLAFGLPGIFVYKTANTLDSMIGHLSPRYRAFGWAAARLDDALNLAPARIAATLIALAAWLLPGASASGALLAMRRDATKH